MFILTTKIKLELSPRHRKEIRKFNCVWTNKYPICHNAKLWINLNTNKSLISKLYKLAWFTNNFKIKMQITVLLQFYCVKNKKKNLVMRKVKKNKPRFL